MNIKILLLIICIICHVNVQNILAEIVTVTTTTATESSKDFETTTLETSVQNVTEIKKDDGEPLPTPLALKTFRSYIEPSFTIIKHRTRFIKPRSKPRRRIKIPKPVYGPPNYVAGDPITIYKPQLDSFELSTISSSIPKIKYEKSKIIKPNYFDSDSEIDIQSIPLADFKKYLPSNNYDFSRNGYYEKQPISFDLYENLHLSKEGSYNGFGHNQQQKFEEHYVVNKIPENKYQKYPAPHPTYSSSESYEIPSSNSHSISGSGQSSYEPSSHGYDSDPKSFAEPPIDIHYSYDTEYEINPLPPSKKTHIYSGQKYLPPTDSTNYKDTPESSIYKGESPDYNSGGTGYFAEPPYHDSYAPIENSKLPLDNSEKTTTYDYPKSSYEVPLYDTSNVNSDSAVHDEYYPPNIPNTHLNIEDDNNLAKSTKKVEISLINNTTKNPIKTKHQRSQTQTISTQNVPLTSPKSTNQKPSQVIEYLESSLNSTTLKPRRKRKRTRTPPTQKIHNLDTDELRDAFGSETNQKSEKILHSHFIPTPLEPKLSLNSPENENSDIVQLHKNHLENNNDFYAYLWEPVKVKELTTRNKTSKLHKKNPLVTTTDSSRNHPPMPTKNIEVISVQKSKSHSYYDGTISPEVFKELDSVRIYPPKYQNIRDNSNNFAVLTSNIMVSTNSDIEKNFKLKGSVIDEKIENNNPTYEYLTKEVPSKT